MLTTIEKEAIQAFRQNDADSGCTSQNDHNAWLKFGIRFLLDVGHIIRASRFGPLNNIVEFKADGSPSLPLEQQIEEILRQRLAIFAPEAGLIGEEGGGSLHSNGIFAAIDPVDGTWSLLNRYEAHSTSLAFFENGQVFLGMILNSATGELAYALGNNPTRLIQLALFGEHDDAFELPLNQSSNRASPGNPLVNVHPGKNSSQLVKRLFDGWNRNDITMVRAPGGSPSWALLEAAKGVYTYVNMWAGKPADPFDLAAGISMVRGAGGDVLGQDGTPVDMTGHKGPFVAGIDKKCLSDILNLLVETAN
jgi:myo-inositol-1(or 4)-monophosphatase